MAELALLLIRLFFLIWLLGLYGCSVPSNYLAPNTIRAPYQINGAWCFPHLIPIMANTIHTPAVRAVIEPSLQAKTYCVGAYDNLTIIVWGHPELSTVMTSPQLTCTTMTLMNAPNPTMPAILVQSDGRISYPLIGQPLVAGLTVRQIEVVLTQQLRRYIRNPQVSVQVAKFRNRNIYVLGEVKNPGQQPLTDKPLSLMEALTTASIDPTHADTDNIYLIRGDYKQPYIFWWCGKTPQSLLLAQRFLLEENDIVYVCAATMSGWNRFINEILPSLESYFLLRNLVP